jgi:hypothetical protein
MYVPGFTQTPLIREVGESVQQLIMAACKFALSRSSVACASYLRVRAAFVTFSARSMRRVQIVTDVRGRTAACASITLGANFPAPTTDKLRALDRAKYRVARADAALSIPRRQSQQAKYQLHQTTKDKLLKSRAGIALILWV